MASMCLEDSDSSHYDSDSFESCTEEPEDGRKSGSKHKEARRIQMIEKVLRDKLNLPLSQAVRHSGHSGTASGGRDVDREFQQKPNLPASRSSWTSYAAVASGKKFALGFPKHESHFPSLQGSCQTDSGRPSEREPDSASKIQTGYATYQWYTELPPGEEYDVEIEEEIQYPSSQVDHFSYADAASGRSVKGNMFRPTDLPYQSHAEEATARSFGKEFEPEPPTQTYDSVPYSTAEMTQGPNCICNDLMQALQDWCRLTHDKRSHHRDQVSSVLDLLDHLRNYFETLQTVQSSIHQPNDPYAGKLGQLDPKDIPLCPFHGFPDMSVNSQCEECAEQFTEVNSMITAGVFEARPPLDKATRKEITKANKTLVKLKEKVDSAMETVKPTYQNLYEAVEWMDFQKEQVVRTMSGHVKRLHESIDFHYQIAQEGFLQEHVDFRQQLLQDIQQVKDFTSRAAEMQAEIQNKFTEIRNHGLSAANTVPDMVHEFDAVLTQKPQPQVIPTPVYSAVVQQAADEELASLVGHFRITQYNAAMASSSHHSSLDASQGFEQPSICPAVDENDHSWTAPEILPEALDPYYPYMEEGGGEEASSLGSKDKQSAFMASTASVASSVNMPGKAKRNKRKKKKNVQAASKDLPCFSTDRFKSKPQTLAIQEGTDLVITKFKGPEPRSIAPTKNGKIWAVFGVRSPELQLLNEKGSVLKRFRVGGNAMAVAVLDRYPENQDQILLASHSPFVHLTTVSREGKCTDVVNLDAAPTSISVGTTGVAVSGHTSLCWVTLSDWSKEWIVPVKNSPLKEVCATAVTSFNDDELICAADKVGKAVHFYMRNDTKGFSSLLPYGGPPMSTDKDRAKTFVPISLAAHPKGFVAILDSASNSVLVLNVEYGHQAVSVIPGRKVYRSCVPSLIAIGHADNSDNHLKLWAVAKSVDTCFICQSPLIFQHDGQDSVVHDKAETD